MAIVFSQSWSNLASNTSSVSATVSPTAGHLLIVGGFWADNDNSHGLLTTALTDNNSNSYTFIASVPAVNDHSEVRLYYLQNAPSGITTITFSAATLATGNIQVGVWDFSGVKTSGALDTSGTILETTGSPVGAVLTPSISGELLANYTCPNTTILTGVNSPWTFNDPGTGGGGGHNIAYYINSPLSGQQAVYTPTGSQVYKSVGATFLPAPTAIFTTMGLVF